MSISECAKTGLPMKRKGWHDWLTIQVCPCSTQFKKHAVCPDPSYMFPDYVDPKLTAEDITADDWLVHVNAI